MQKKAPCDNLPPQNKTKCLFSTLALIKTACCVSGTAITASKPVEIYPMTSEWRGNALKITLGSAVNEFSIEQRRNESAINQAVLQVTCLLGDVVGFIAGFMFYGSIVDTHLDAVSLKLLVCHETFVYAQKVQSYGYNSVQGKCDKRHLVLQVTHR